MTRPQDQKSHKKGCVRPVANTDADAAYRLILEAAREAQYPIGPHWTKTQVAEECAGLGWVHEDERGELAAFVLFRDLIDALEISFLSTSINARGHGLMNALLQHLFSEKSPEKPVWLEVHVENHPARKLYEKLGFKQVGQRPNYYSDGGTAVLYNYG